MSYRYRFDGRARSGARPSPWSARRTRAPRDEPLSASRRTSARAAVDVMDHAPIVHPRATARQPCGASVGAPVGCPIGHTGPPRRAPGRALSGAPRAVGALAPSGSDPHGKGHACRTICRPASTSRRSRPAPVRSRAWARPSPHSSGSPARAREHARRWSRTGPVHVQTFGDFIEGSYLAHAVYGYFLNGGGAGYVVRDRRRRRRADRARPSCRARRRTQARGYRVAALEAGPAGNDISVEVSSRRRPSRGQLQARRQAGRQGRSRRSTTSRPSKGKQNVVTVVKAQSKLIAIEEVGSAAVAGAHRPPARSRSPAGAPACPSRVTPDDYVGNAADRTGFAGLEAVDEVTMLSVPDLMAVYEQGDHRPRGRPGRPAGDDRALRADGRSRRDPRRPPGLNAQQIKEWRVDKAGYDCKYATLYWPWFKVFDPPVGPGEVRAPVRPHGGHLGAQRRHPRRPQGAGQRGRILDTPPGLNAQQVKDWRVDDAGYDSKYAALYWPWIKIMDPLKGQPMFVPPSRPHGRHLGAQRRQPRRPQGAGQRGRAGRASPRAQPHQGRARPAHPNAINCIRAFPGRGSASGARARSRATPRGATSGFGVARKRRRICAEALMKRLLHARLLQCGAAESGRREGQAGLRPRSFAALDPGPLVKGRGGGRGVDRRRWPALGMARLKGGTRRSAVREGRSWRRSPGAA